MTTYLTPGKTRSSEQAVDSRNIWHDHGRGLIERDVVRDMSTTIVRSDNISPKCLLLQAADAIADLELVGVHVLSDPSDDACCFESKLAHWKFHDTKGHEDVLALKSDGTTKMA